MKMYRCFYHYKVFECQAACRLDAYRAAIKRFEVKQWQRLELIVREPGENGY